MNTTSDRGHHSPEKGGHDMATTHTTTFQVTCPCGCGAAVTAHDSGFAAVTVEVEACPTLAAAGERSRTMRKSWGYANAVPVSAGWQHRDGLVVFA